MKLICCMIVVLALFWFLSKKTKNPDVGLYIGSIVLALVSVLVPSKSLPAPLSYFFVQILQRGVLAGALFIWVMVASVWPKGEIKTVTMKMRAQMAICASLLTIIHNFSYGKKYFVLLFTGAKMLPYQVIATCFSLIMILLLIPLTVTSFKSVRKKMKPKFWKKLQSLSYIFYGLLFAHIVMIFSGPIHMGKVSYIFDLLVYAIIYIAYLVLRIKKYPAKKTRYIALICGIILLAAYSCSGLFSAQKVNQTNQTEATQAKEASGYKDGSYEGKGMGNNGNIEVRVTVEGGKIKNIEVTKEVDDEEYYNDAEKCVLPAIIEKQSPDVDTVSCSTYSSKGLIDAVTDALSKAK